MNSIIFISFLFIQPIEVKSNQWEKISHIAIMSLNVSQFADLSTTMYMSGKGGFKEANPLLRPFYKSPIKMALVKGGLATLVSYTLFRMHKNHPKLVIFLSSSLASLTGYVAYRNSKILEGNK
jgi:hypothetical protein